MPDPASEPSEPQSRDALDRDRLQTLFRRLHGGPMQAVATALILLAAWERAVAAGDTNIAVEASRMLGDQVRSIGPALQAIEREGLEVLGTTSTKPTTAQSALGDVD